MKKLRIYYNNYNKLINQSLKKILAYIITKCQDRL